MGRRIFEKTELHQEEEWGEGVFIFYLRKIRNCVFFLRDAGYLVKLTYTKVIRGREVFKLFLFKKLTVSFLFFYRGRRILDEPDLHQEGKGRGDVSKLFLFKKLTVSFLFFL